MKFFNIHDRALGDRSASGAVSLFDALATKNGGSGWEVWAFDDSQ